MAVVVQRSGDIARITITEQVTASELFELTDRLEHLDRATGLLPRLIDARTVTGVGLSFPEMARFVERLKTFSPRQPVKTAIVVGSDVAHGFARMFAALRQDSLFLTAVFRDEGEALAWIAAPVDRGEA